MLRLASGESGYSSFHSKETSRVNARLAALDSISACLSVDKSAGNLTVLDRKIASGEIDWQQVIAIANTNLVSASLWSELRSHQLEGKLPKLVHDYLREIHRLNTIRNHRLIEQTTEVVKGFNALGVEPILLKGIAALFTKTYLDIGSRMLTDIDVLVPRHQAIKCWEMLCTQGYSPLDDGGDYSRHHHLHPLTRAGEYAVIEIHTDILMPARTGRLLGHSLTRADSKLITSLVVEAAQSACIDELRASIPCPTHRVLHCLLHAAFLEFNAYRAGTLPLKSLHELALLQNLFKSKVDWADISRLLKTSRNTKLLRDWVYLAHKLFDSPMPSEWSTTAHMRAHHTRCRLQARWGLAITLREIKRVL